MTVKFKRYNADSDVIGGTESFLYFFKILIIRSIVKRVHLFELPNVYYPITWTCLFGPTTASFYLHFLLLSRINDKF